jgi:hypothetical protein
MFNTIICDKMQQRIDQAVYEMSALFQLSKPTHALTRIVRVDDDLREDRS